MKFRLASDIHIEFFHGEEYRMAEIANLILPPLPDDVITTLILAGDIGSMHHPETLESFLDEICPRFEAVRYIPGNHEYYGGDLRTAPALIGEMAKKYDSLFFTELGGSILPLSNKTLHMTTLWTDFDKENPISMNEAAACMNDYRLITNGRRTARPQDMLEMHKNAFNILKELVKEGDIVVTHHSPSLRSIPSEYLTNRVNGAYHSDLSEFIAAAKPAIWCHGHTHTACDYVQDNTRIICNPRGYGNQYKKNGYRPDLVFEV